MLPSAADQPHTAQQCSRVLTARPRRYREDPSSEYPLLECRRCFESECGARKCAHFDAERRDVLHDRAVWDSDDVWLAPSFCFFVHIFRESSAGEHRTKILDRIDAQYGEPADPVNVDLKGSKR